MNKPTKILITIDWFLPGTLSGGPVRSYANLIAHLKDDFEFYIITRNTDYGLEIPYEGITPNQWTALNDTTKIHYISTDMLNKTNLKRIIAEIDFDVALINGIYSWYFSILPITLLKKQNKPIIVSARGMLNPQAFSVKGFKKKLFLALSKIYGLYKGVSFHATNQDEAIYIKAQIGMHANVQVAPNLPREWKQDTKKVKVLHKPIRFVNVARISVEKGTLVMLKALKSIKHPLILDLYGPIYDEVYWRKCLSVIDELPKTIKINYQGVVDSEAIPETLANYDFLVLLSEGENFGHAILEAFSAGLPVLISNLTPWKNLKSQRLGWDVNIRAESEILKAFAEALDMTMDEYKEWSDASIQFAKEFIDNPEVLEQNKALFLNTIN